MSDDKPAASRSHAFWEFSLRLYASPAVQAACLELQDDCGVDVNVLLFMLYLASTGRRITADEARGVLAGVEPWRAQVVVPLRTARRNLKTPVPGFDATAAETLRSIVKKAELEAERQQQAALHARSLDTDLGSPAPRQTAAVANIAVYGAALGRQLATGPVSVMLAAFEASPVQAG